MDPAIQEFVEGKRIAIVGVSRGGKKFGNIAYRELQKRGYQVFAVHPDVTQIEGEPCYPDLASLRGRVDGGVVCVPGKQGEKVLRQAAENGMHRVWIQQGGESPELLALAKQLGLQAVSGRCILMYAQPVQGFHRWHRGWNRLVGKL